MRGRRGGWGGGSELLGLDWKALAAVLNEVAAVGPGGLQVNEASTSRTLKSLPGRWSDLAVACLIQVGM